jgi:hypothetical protein
MDHACKAKLPRFLAARPALGATHAERRVNRETGRLCTHFETRRCCVAADAAATATAAGWLP